jgi:aryl-phospho-beta-D-glucosidase BglC (GH1 family)
MKIFVLCMVRLLEGFLYKGSLSAFCFTLLMLCSTANAVYSQSRLRADGTRIVNVANQEVLLKGVGLGGWLVQEGYMMKPDFTGGGTQWSIKKRLYDQGVSEADVETFYQDYRNNFITKADIDYIASLGFNCVRLPMHYELFLTATQRSVRNSVIRNSANYTNYVNSLSTWYDNNELFNDPANLEGFKTIDNILNWAGANNMYVILDLHAAPGAQGTDANISDALVGNDLWNRRDGKNRLIYQDITNRLWERIASRYINDSRVAFYDLINEPNNVDDNRKIHNLTERLINTIRGLGDTHLIMVEGNGWGNNYNYMEPWTFTNRSNLVYNAHRYWVTNDVNAREANNANQINLIGNLVDFRRNQNVPVWVGETGENSDEWLRENVYALNSQGIGWAHWTYKRTSSSPNAALLRINPPYLIDGADNRNAVLTNIRFSNCVPNTGPIAAVAPGLTTPPPTSTAPIGQTIWLKGFNNLYVSSEDGTTAMTCTRTSVQDWEKFTVVDAGGGKIALRGMGKYVSSENGQQAITCSRTSIQDWEKFDWIVNADGKISLRGSNGLYVSSENGTTAMTCNRTSISGWEAFTYGIGAAARVANLSKEKDLDKIQVYPNPNRGETITVKLDFYTPGSQVVITVIDGTGKIVLSKKAANEVVKLPATRQLKSGLYTVRIVNGSQVVYKKLVVVE